MNVKRMAFSVLLCAVLGPLLVGCSHKDTNNFANMSRQQQMDHMQPNPEKMKEMAAKYSKSGGPPQAAPGTNNATGQNAGGQKPTSH